MSVMEVLLKPFVVKNSNAVFSSELSLFFFFMSSFVIFDHRFLSTYFWQHRSRFAFLLFYIIYCVTYYVNTSK